MARGRANRSVCLLATTLAAVMPASAHHSIAAVYDSAKRLTLEASVTEFHFVNPHPFLVVDVPGRGGAPESWRLEMDNRWELSEIGITSDTFRPGDRVVVSGSAGRTQPRTLYLLRLDRTLDGLRYEQIGFSPHVTIQSKR
jgi:hypothetical protein